MNYRELMLHIGQRVQTPKGKGKLDNVLGPNYVRVLLDGMEARTTDFNENDVKLLVPKKKL